MATTLYDKLEVEVTTPTISRALASAAGLEKLLAKERNADLQGFYLHNLSEFRHITWFTLTNLDATTGLGSGGLDGHLWG